MKYAIYKLSGEIESVNDDTQPYGQFIELPSNFDNRLFYCVERGALVEYPLQPSPHHTFNYTTKQWEDPRTLADLKAQQWDAIKVKRFEAEYAGFTWDGSTFDSDAVSQQRLSGAVLLAQMSPSFTIDWNLFDDTVRTLNQSDMIAVGVALGVHVQTGFAKGQALRAQIDAATTKEQVEAVVW